MSDDNEQGQQQDPEQVPSDAAGAVDVAPPPTAEPKPKPKTRVAPIDPESEAGADLVVAMKATAKPGEVKLFHPRYEQLEFGDRTVNGSNVIRFGPRGGFAPRLWIGSEDHPLLPALLAKHPDIREVTDTPKIYVCAVCEQEFNAKIAWRSHTKSKHPTP